MKKFCKSVFLLIFYFLSVVLVVSMFQGIQDFISSFFKAFLFPSWYSWLCVQFQSISLILKKIWILQLIIILLHSFNVSFIIPLIYKNKWLKQVSAFCANPNQNLQHELYNYVNANNNTCFLIDGAWGVGKSWQIKLFIEDLKKTHYRKVYNVSCFGLFSREAITEELVRVCETSDTSFKKKYIDLIHTLPIVGDFLFSILKTNYELASIPRGSIFVFDDFERVANLLFDEESYDRPVRTSTASELNETFKSVSSRIANIAIKDNAIVATQYADKFSVVIGFINDLIENYGMRVVILANLSLIPYKIIRDTLESKLNCRRFNLYPDETKIAGTIRYLIENDINLDAKKRSAIEEYFQSHTLDIVNTWNSTNLANLRILCSAVTAFTILIEQNQLDQIKEFMDDIFISILICHIEYESGNHHVLKLISTGENPLFFGVKRKLFSNYERRTIQIKDYLGVWPNKGNIRWIGYRYACGYIEGNYNLIFDSSFFERITGYNNLYGASFLENDGSSHVSPTNIDDFIYEICIKEDIDLDTYTTLIENNRIDFRNFSNAINGDYEKLKKKIDNIINLISRMNINKNDYEITELNDFLSLFFDKLETEYPTLRSWFKEHYQNSQNEYEKYILRTKKEDEVLPKGFK